ncbi:MAG TPA: hypothetical protein VKR53_00975 [Puia sp.]|nr:hypothetical protein [Puia sp.]
MNKEKKGSIFDYIFEGIGSIQIIALPAIIGLIAAGFIYKPTLWRSILAGAIGIGGLVIGIIWANSIAKKEGSINFMSGVSASPELDKKEPEEREIGETKKGN